MRNYRIRLFRSRVRSSLTWVSDPRLRERVFSKNPGKWRSGSISVIDDETGEAVYQGPPAREVQPLMEELVDHLRGNSPEPGQELVEAAMAHINLTMIHPFSDGNGRMARCLQTLVLARIGILAPPFSNIEEYLGQNTRAYYSVLADVGQSSWNPQNDAKPWIRFCLTAHYRQIATLIRRFEKMRDLWNRIEEELGKRRLPGRMIFALAEAAIGLKIRNSRYRANAEVSSGLASRDLRALVDYKLLEPRGERRGRYYLATPEIRELGKRNELEKRIVDPFDLKEGDDIILVLPGMEEFVH